MPELKAPQRFEIHEEGSNLRLVIRSTYGGTLLLVLFYAFLMGVLAFDQFLLDTPVIIPGSDYSIVVASLLTIILLVLIYPGKDPEITLSPERVRGPECDVETGKIEKVEIDTKSHTSYYKGGPLPCRTSYYFTVRLILEGDYWHYPLYFTVDQDEAVYVRARVEQYVEDLHNHKLDRREELHVEPVDRIRWYRSRATGKRFPVYIFGEPDAEGKRALTSREKPEVLMTNFTERERRMKFLGHGGRSASLCLQRVYRNTGREDFELVQFVEGPGEYPEASDCRDILSLRDEATAVAEGSQEVKDFLEGGGRVFILTGEGSLLEAGINPDKTAANGCDAVHEVTIDPSGG